MWNGIKRAGAWVWSGWGNILWIAGLLTGFALPAWAVRVTGVFLAYSPLSWVVAGFCGMAAAAFSMALASWSRVRWVRSQYDAKALAQGGTADPLARIFENKRIYLNEFVLPSNPLIEDKTFVDCEIVGPANVILLFGNSVSEHRLPVCDAMVIREGGDAWNGYVFRNCVFRGCKFIRVTLMFSTDEFEKAKDVNWLRWISIRPDDMPLFSPAPPAPTPLPSFTDLQETNDDGPTERPLRPPPRSDGTS